MKTRITDTDHGYRRLLTTVRKWKRKTIKVGLSDAQHEGTDLTIAQLGAIHEFGLGNVPPRSFLRAWVDQNQKEWMSWLRTGVLEELMKSRQWASNFGRYAVKGVQALIRKGIPPELQDATVKAKARKGQPATPLIATEQLIDGVEYEVEQ